MRPAHLALAVLVAAVRGVNFVVIEIGLGRFPPLLFCALRFLAAAVPAVFFVRRPGVPLCRIVAVGLVLGVAKSGPLFIGMDPGMPAGLSSLVLLTALRSACRASGPAGSGRPAWASPSRGSASPRTTRAPAARSAAWITTVFGFGAWGLLPRTYDASAAAPFSLLVPVSGVTSLGSLGSIRPGRGEGAGLRPTRRAAAAGANAPATAAPAAPAPAGTGVSRTPSTASRPSPRG